MPLNRTDNEGFGVGPSKATSPHFLCLILDPFSHRNSCQIVCAADFPTALHTAANSTPTLKVKLLFKVHEVEF